MYLGSLRTSSLHHIAKNATWEGKKLPDETRWAAAWFLYVRLTTYSGSGEEFEPDHPNSLPLEFDDCEEVIKDELKANSEAEVRMHAIFWLTEAANGGEPNAINSLCYKASWGLNSEKNEEDLNAKILNLEKRLTNVEDTAKTTPVVLIIIASVCFYFLLKYLKQ